MNILFNGNKIKLINYALTVSLSAVGFLLMAVWFNITPSQKISIRVAPPLDAVRQSLSSQKINIKGTFTRFSGIPSLLTYAWSGFRGPRYDNIDRSTIPLVDTLDESNLPIVWSQKLGEGYAGAAVRNGCVYVMDYDKEMQSDTLRCFSLADGKEIWRRAYRIRIKRNHGMSRTVPAVSDSYVVTIGPKCQVMCVDALSGEYKWGIDLVAQYNTEVPLWYTAQCPVIDGNIAVIAPAGTVLLMGVDLESGSIVWETPNPDNFKMSHASIMPMTFHNRKMYVYSSIGGMVGVAASGSDTGKILWKTTEWTHSVISPSPVKVDDNKVFVAAGYGGGSMMFEIVEKDGQFEAKKLFKRDKEVFACEQHTPIYYKGHLFSVLPNDAGEMNRQLVCMDADGTIQWTSGRNDRFGLGPFIISDDKIFVLDDDGMLSIIEASVTRYKKYGQAQVLSGRESWGPIALAGGYMILRDFEQMTCLDLKKI